VTRSDTQWTKPWANSPGGRAGGGIAEDRQNSPGPGRSELSTWQENHFLLAARCGLDIHHANADAHLSARATTSSHNALLLFIGFMVTDFILPFFFSTQALSSTGIMGLIPPAYRRAKLGP
jgi:hypothetical protein